MKINSFYNLKFSTPIIIFFLFLFSINPVNAGDSLMNMAGGSIQPACVGSGNCTMNDFIGIAINVSKIILGLSGSAALLFFIYGGVMFLISGGSQERVNKGKQIIVGSVIGLFVIFGSYMIISFTLEALGLDSAKGGWFEAKPLEY